MFLLRKKKKIQVQLSIIHFTCTYTSALLYHSIPPAFVCFCTSALQCSWVDLMISTAKSCQKREIRFSTFSLSCRASPPAALLCLFSNLTLSLNSPLNPNWFSGFPSGTLYFLNHSTVASKWPGRLFRTSSIPEGRREKLSRRLLRFPRNR